MRVRTLWSCVSTRSACLALIRQPTNFMNAPALGPVATPLDENRVVEKPGTLIGPYKPHGTIGEGAWPGVRRPRAEKARAAARALKGHQAGDGFQASGCSLRGGATGPWSLMDHPN